MPAIGDDPDRGVSLLAGLQVRHAAISAIAGAVTASGLTSLQELIFGMALNRVSPRLQRGELTRVRRRGAPFFVKSSVGAAMPHSQLPKGEAADERIHVFARLNDRSGGMFQPRRT